MIPIGESYFSLHQTLGIYQMFHFDKVCLTEFGALLGAIKYVVYMLMTFMPGQIMTALWRTSITQI